MAHDEHPSHHIIPPIIYWKTFGILMILFILTFVAAQIHVWPLTIRWVGILVALAIATVKAVYVVVNFMGVKFGSRLVWLWASLGFIWLAILFLIIGDYVTRDMVSVPGW